MKKIKPDGSKTLYVGGIYEVDKASGGSVTRTVTYYPVAGAMRVDGTLYYLLKDHLGSASVLTNASGNAVSGADVRYYPFGEARSSTSSMVTDKLFTGQREMAGLGIYHYQARFYSPKLGRFLSADTITPNPANPQNFNRYSYVTNNPLLYIDPTGHDADYFCSGSDDYSSRCTGYVQDQGTLGSGGNNGGGGGGAHPPIVLPETLPCGGMLTCNQPSPYDYIESLLPFNGSDVCDFLAQGQMICNTSSWQNFPSFSITSSGCLQNFWSCYDPDAILWGAGASGSGPGFYSTVGLEELVMFSNGTRATFIYGGQGSSAGAGASASAYVGLVVNLEDPDNYNGPFGSAGITISVLDAGVTAFYFWDSSREPLSAGTTQGLAVGYAPGAQASIWGSSTVYSLTWRSDR